MKTIYKVLICLGLGICFIIGGMSLNGINEMNEMTGLSFFHWQWHSKEIGDRHFESNESVNELKVELYKSQIEFHESHDLNHVVVDAKQIYSGFEVYQDQNRLVIKQPHYWFDWGSRDKSIIDVYVPAHHQFDYAKVETNAGNVKVINLSADSIKLATAAGNLRVHGLNAQDLKTDTGMGQTYIDNLSIHEKLKVDVGMGNAKIVLNGKEEDYHYDVDVGLGNAKIGSQRFSGIADRESMHSTHQKEIKVDVGFGNVEIEMEE